MVFLVQSLYFASQALATSSNANNDCPIFSIKYGCDLSAWSHLIIDGLIAAFLGVFFHHLAHKQSLKLKIIVEEHGQSQSIAQANVCGNGKGASDVNCQNLANQVQGDGNAVNVIGVQSGGGGGNDDSHNDGSDNGGNAGQTGQLGVRQSGTSGNGDGSGGSGSNNNNGHAKDYFHRDFLYIEKEIPFQNLSPLESVR